MKYAAVIVDNRPEVAKEAIERHKKYLPKDIVIDWVSIPETSTAEGYNRLLTSFIFWYSYIKYDRVLIFQHDSGLLRDGIEEFWEYHFIGAPIKHMPGYMNGGLSIRDPKIMLHICEFFKYSGSSIDGNEDIYFLNHVRRLGRNIPSMQTASRFSVETQFNLGSLGYHAIDKYLTIDEIHAIMTQYDK